MALWAAQLLLCEQPAEEPCGNCRSCRLVLGLGHPDVHWFMPVPRPKASEPDKQVEELAEAFGEILEERRKHPLYGPLDGLAGHFVATARLLSRQAVLKPVEGRGRVFILGSAERLVPQESSPEAANALLKLFEEPAAGTCFILTAADAAGVLPTIRSRAATLRISRLADAEVREFLARWLEPKPGPEELERLVRRADGAIGNAVDDQGDREKAEQAAMALLEAVLGSGPGGWEAALKQTPFSARGNFTRTLDAMADLLSRGARQSLTGSGGPRRLTRVPPQQLVAALERVGEARELARGNVNPQVLLAVLGRDLAEVL